MDRNAAKRGGPGAAARVLSDRPAGSDVVAAGALAHRAGGVPGGVTPAGGRGRTRAHAGSGEGDGSGRWRRRREARPGEILTAALEQFVEHGFAATKMEDIARRAGVTKGTVYLYYPSKEELFRAAVEETIVPSLSLGEQLLEEKSASASQLFRALIATWWDFMSAPPLSGIPKLIVAEAANFPAIATFFAEKVQQRGRRMFERVLERGVAAGEFRADLDVHTAARVALAPVVWSLVHRHSLHKCEHGGVDLDAFLELHVDVFLRGIAAETVRIDGGEAN